MKTNFNIMKKDDLVKQLANRINQPHVVESWINKIQNAAYKKGVEDGKKEQLELTAVSFELPNDNIFEKDKVELKNPLERFYYYHRPPYSKTEQKDFRKMLQEALNFLKGN
jgi:hypothetical protein